MMFRKWGKSKHFHKYKNCLQNNYLKYSVKLGGNRRFSFQLVTMVLMVYKRTAHSLFSPPRHAPEPSAPLPVSSRPPLPPISYAITGPEATLVTPLLAGPHSMLQRMLGDSRAGLRHKPRGAECGHDPGCRAGLAAISKAGEEAEGPGCRCPGQGACALRMGRTGLVSPQYLGRFPFWLEDCSLQSLRSSVTGLPLRYKPTRALTPETQSRHTQGKCSESKGAGHLPSQVISSCIDRSERTSV